MEAMVSNGEVGMSTEQPKMADKAKDVAATAAESGRQVASTATEQARDVAGHAAQEARDLVHEARQHLREQARTQTGQVAQGLQRLGEQARALAEGRHDEAGPLGDYARQFAGTFQGWADRVETRGFDGVVDDVKGFARRRPGAFLLGAALAGMAVGRVIRSAQAGGSPSGSSPSAMSSSWTNPSGLGATTALPSPASTDSAWSRIETPGAAGTARPPMAPPVPGPSSFSPSAVPPTPAGGAV